MKPHDREEHIQHTFDSYCKKILRYKARTCYNRIQAQAEREVSFSELSAREQAGLAVMDEYFTGSNIFNVLGESVGVTDAGLAEALNTLPVDRREIVLMSYFFDMSDREIAQKLNMARRTVAYRRNSTLRELKRFMESEGQA